MVESSRCPETGTVTIRLGPNRSMGSRTLALIFLALAGGSLLFSGMLAVQGFWLPLPFAGAEVLALGLSLAWLRRELATDEEIAIADDGVCVRRTDRLGERETCFHRGWVRVELRPARYPRHPRRLLLRAHGRELEVGAFLGDRERRTLAAGLDAQLKVLPRPTTPRPVANGPTRPCGEP